ncbi:hypothetical protein DQX05_06575 [Paenibacillus thiaminolyticus]|uniref:Uncharacterized protein n=1 Tax=Paenibacillus thiaminolyticus TaxID=49283 RepID=A0A3A3GMR1_PANTH|nr:hypothetical protein DQX05_06575 [Paenibacillus thiaminolyticus]
MSTEDGMKQKGKGGTRKGLSISSFSYRETAPPLIPAHSEVAKNTVKVQFFFMSRSPLPEVLQNSGC